MKIWYFVFLAFILVSTNVYSLGLATPPESNIHAFIGDDLVLKIGVINQEGIVGDYKILFEGDLASRATANPPILTIVPDFGVNKDKLENAQVRINSSGLLPGTYYLKIVVELFKSRDGGLSIVQQVTRGITITYEYPPSALNKALNYVIIKIKDIKNWIKSKIVNFYNNNLWLNYIFVTIMLVVFFYIGTRSDEILKKLLKLKKTILSDIKKIKSKGFKKWIETKRRDSFKKLKEQAKDIVAKDGKKDDKQDFV